MFYTKHSLITKQNFKYTVSQAEMKRGRQ